MNTAIDIRTRQPVATVPENEPELDKLGREGREALETVGRGVSRILKTKAENAVEMREAWRAYGAVLLRGRELMPGSITFGKWVEDQKLDLGLGQKAARSAAMRMAKNWEFVARGIEANILNPDWSHPQNIMKALRKMPGLAYRSESNTRMAIYNRAYRAKTIGWVEAVRAIYGAPLPSEYTRKTKGGSNFALARAEIETRIGEKIPPRIVPGSNQAEKIASAIRALHIEKNPAAALAASAATVVTARAEVPESKQAQFDRLLSQAKDAQATELRARFFETVEAEVTKRLPDEAKREIERARESVEAAQGLERIWRHRASKCVEALNLFMGNWRTLIGCLHPDRQAENDDARRNRASDIVTRTKGLIEATDYEKWS